MVSDIKKEGSDRKKTIPNSPVRRNLPHMDGLLISSVIVEYLDTLSMISL